MDRLSGLSDDLLLKVLFFLPTKDAVNTSLLSKRWCSLWKHLPNLTYRDPTYGVPSRDSEFWRASRFVDKFLLLNKAPTLETLDLILGRNCPNTDIETWIRIAISRGVRDLQIIQYIPGPGALRLPRVIFTCETLVTLFITSHIIVNDVPSTVCLRSLKTLFLFPMIFSSDDVVARLLSGCPVLNDLNVVRASNDKVKTFTIDVPSLRTLTINDVQCGSHVPGEGAGFVIKAPRLNSLTIANRFDWSYSFVKMPFLVTADISFIHGDCMMFKECFVSTKHVSLCLQPPAPTYDSFPIGIMGQLVSLNLCTCSLDWCLLVLRHARKLRVLRFEPNQVRLSQKNKVLRTCHASSIVAQPQWEQTTSVPECLNSSLETVEWIDYKGIEAEKRVVMYLLENSGNLKQMAINSLKSINDKEKLEMLQEISSARRSSTKCRLSFT